MITKYLLAPAYFGPIPYFEHLAGGQGIIEQHGNYTRQTYRNRCVILGANSPLTLSVPVEKSKYHNQRDKEVRIAYHTPWQRLHWRSIVSAYNASPYFQYYQDDLHPFFTKKTTFLFDLNMAITQQMLELTGIDAELVLSQEYKKQPGAGILDLRDAIHPKRAEANYNLPQQPVEYRQVFDQRHGFIPNLSILDLLFNKGPESILILEQRQAIDSPVSMPSQ